MYPRAAEYLRPIHVFAKYCAILPISSSVINSSVPQFYVVYCFLIFVLPVKNMIFAIPYYYSKFTDVVCFTTFLYMGLRYGLHVVSIVVPFLRSKVYIKLFKRLNYAEVLIDSLNIKQKSTPSKTWQLFWITLKVSTDVVIFTLTRVYLNVPVIVNLGFFSLSYPSFGEMMHTIALLKVIKSKFININWHLFYLNNKTPPYLTRSGKRAFIENKIRCGKTDDYFTDFNAPNFRTVSASKIKTFNKIHFLLCTSSNLINSYYSLQIFMSVLKIVLENIVIFILSFDRRRLMGNYASAASYIISALYGVWWVFVMAKLCHDIKIQSRRTAILVHDLLNEEQSESSIRQLEIFSKQLMVRKVKFSAFNFFDVDLKMITPMVGIALPVTLFLVQYNNNRQRI